MSRCCFDFDAIDQARAGLYAFEVLFQGAECLLGELDEFGFRIVVQALLE